MPAKALSAALILAFLAAAPARADADGEAVFKQACFVCHTVEPGKNKIGPSLAGVAGRKAGTVDGYAYSEAMKSSGKTWDAATLDAYLTDPRGVVPGTKMTYAGLKDDEKRKALIQYLGSH